MDSSFRGRGRSSQLAPRAKQGLAVVVGFGRLGLLPPPAVVAEKQRLWRLFFFCAPFPLLSRSAAHGCYISRLILLAVRHHGARAIQQVSQLVR